jgi:O-antigen ligase
MKLLAALLTIVALVGALVLDLAYLYPILGALVLGLFILLKLDHLFLALLLITEGFIFGALGYGANTLLGLRVGYSDLLLAGLSVAALVRMVNVRGQLEGQRLRFSLFLVWGLLFLLSVVVHPEVFESGMSKFQLFCVNPFLIFLVGSNCLDRRERLEQGLIALAVVAIPLGLMILNTWVQAGFSSEETGLDAASLREATEEGTYLFRNKNISGAVFAALAPLFIGAAGALKSWLGRLASAGAAAVSMGVVFLSLSRGSLLSLLAGMFVLGLLGLRSRKVFFLLGTGFSALGLLILESLGLLEPLLLRFQEGADFNRLDLLQASARMIADQPLIGIGQSEFSFLEALGTYSRSDVNLVHPHNSFLQMAVFGGLPLFFTFLLLIGSLLRRPGGHFSVEPSWHRLQASVLAGVVAFLVNMLTDFIYFNSISCFIFWILVTVYASRALWEPSNASNKITEE